jgi:hypothetical protein
MLITTPLSTTQVKEHEEKDNVEMTKEHEEMEGASKSKKDKEIII